jgi:hypothetical protein
MRSKYTHGQYDTERSRLVKAIGEHILKLLESGYELSEEPVISIYMEAQETKLQIISARRMRDDIHWDITLVQQKLLDQVL